MSILRYKRFQYADGGVLRDSGGGGGGGSPSPTQTTVSNTNIPEYAQPYVSNMLNATQAQLFNTQTTPGVPAQYDSSGALVPGTGTQGSTEITGFKPYTPYSNDPSNYVAGFSPMQQQSFQGMANMQVAPQLGQASGMAGMGGLGSLGLAGQAAGAGQNYANMATDPNSIQAYMNPYIQQSLAPQLNLLNQQQAIQGQNIAAGAAGKGAFGGNRETLAQGLNAQNFDLARQQAIGQGYNQAFNQAQQAQQFGANLGLQGYQTGLQGYGQAVNAANALGQLGQTQYGQQMGILQGQNQFGGQQQQNQQQIINQAIQNYATAQQYPLLQLGTMSNMLRGLPLQAQTTSIYQAQPTGTQQAIGLGGTAAALGAAFGKAQGGIIGMKKGGKVPGYKYGAVINDPQLEDYSRGLSAAQLQNRINDPQVTPSERILFQGVQEDQNRLRQLPGAGAAIAQAGAIPQPQPNPEAIQQARMSGLGAAGGPAFDTQRLAGGGIIAFANEGLVPTPEETVGQNSGPGYGFTVSNLGDVLGMLGTETEWQKADRLKRHGIQYTPPEGYSDRGVPIKKETAKKETDEAPVAEKPVAAPPTAAAAPAAPAAPTGGPAAPQFSSNMNLGNPMDMLKQRQAMAKERIEQGGGEKYKALMNVLEQQQANAANESTRDRYLRMAQAFADFGTTPSPGGAGVAGLKSLGKFAAGEAEARKAQRVAEVENMKAQTTLEEARRKEAIGDMDAAEKLYNEHEGHVVSRDNAITQANAHIAGAQIGASAAHSANALKAQQLAGIKADLAQKLGREPTTTEVLQAYTQATSMSDETSAARIRQAAETEYGKRIGALQLDPTYRDLAKKAAKGDKEAIAAKQKMENDLFTGIYNRMSGGTQQAQTQGQLGTASNPIKIN